MSEASLQERSVRIPRGNVTCYFGIVYSAMVPR